jgi:hypothetical protein
MSPDSNNRSTLFEEEEEEEEEEEWQIIHCFRRDNIWEKRGEERGGNWSERKVPKLNSQNSSCTSNRLIYNELISRECIVY